MYVRRMSPPKGSPRELKFTMLMSADERAKLEEVAAAERRTASDWIRNAFLSAYEELPKKKRPAKK